jgi:hypothetical protein
MLDEKQNIKKEKEKRSLGKTNLSYSRHVFQRSSITLEQQFK